MARTGARSSASGRLSLAFDPCARTAADREYPDHNASKTTVTDKPNLLLLIVSPSRVSKQTETS